MSERCSLKLDCDIEVRECFQIWCQIFVSVIFIALFYVNIIYLEGDSKPN